MKIYNFLGLADGFAAVALVGGLSSYSMLAAGLSDGDIDFLGRGRGATAAVFALATDALEADDGGDEDCVRFGLVERLDTGKSITKSGVCFCLIAPRCSQRSRLFRKPPRCNWKATETGFGPTTPICWLPSTEALILYCDWPPFRSARLDALAVLWEDARLSQILRLLENEGISALFELSFCAEARLVFLAPFACPPLELMFRVSAVGFSCVDVAFLL